MQKMLGGTPHAMVSPSDTCMITAGGGGWHQRGAKLRFRLPTG